MQYLFVAQRFLSQLVIPSAIEGEGEGREERGEGGEEMGEGGEEMGEKEKGGGRGEGEGGEGKEGGGINVYQGFLTARSKFSSQIFWPPALDEKDLKTIRPSPFSPRPSPSVFA